MNKQVEATVERVDANEAVEQYIIAVDLDGTLAQYHGWQGEEHIGKPIEDVVIKMANLFDKGVAFYIFSARIIDEKNAKIIEKWAADNGIAPMISGYTNIKHKFFKEFWDDRAKQVVPNSGIFLEDRLEKELAIKADERFSKDAAHEELDEHICQMAGITPKALQVARLMSLPVFNYQHGGSHYKDMLIEPAVYVAANKLGAEEGNVIKYVSRHQAKNGVQDIEKCQHNLEMIKQTRY